MISRNKKKKFMNTFTIFDASLKIIMKKQQKNIPTFFLVKALFYFFLEACIFFQLTDFIHGKMKKIHSGKRNGW